MKVELGNIVTLNSIDNFCHRDNAHETVARFSDTSSSHHFHK